MVDAVLVATAKKMLSAGVSKEEVEKMLESMGYAKDAIESAFKEIDGGKNNNADKEKKESIVVEEEKKKEDISEKVKEHKEEAELASKMAMNVVETAHSKIEEHSKKVEDLHKDIKNVASTIEKIDLPKISNAGDDIKKIRQDLDELAAKTDTLIELLKKVLESQRDILLYLKK